MAHPILAGVLRSLADAPRLPPLDWGTPIKRLLELATSRQPHSPPSSSTQSDFVAADSSTNNACHATECGADTRVNLGAACLLLALKHGSVASHNLGELLDQLMSQQQQFAQLPCQLRQILMIGLPEVLQSLSNQRAAAVAGTLSMLCTLGSNSSAKHFSSLSTAAWIGLARYTSFVQGSDPAGMSQPAMVTEAIYKAVGQLLRKLPLPPYLLPGERLPSPSMDLDTAVSSRTGGGSATCDKGKGQRQGAEHSSQLGPQEGAGQGAEARGPVHMAWGAACACLQMMPKDKVTLLWQYCNL